MSTNPYVRAQPKRESVEEKLDAIRLILAKIHEKLDQLVKATAKEP